MIVVMVCILWDSITFIAFNAYTDNHSIQAIPSILLGYSPKNDHWPFHVIKEYLLLQCKICNTLGNHCKHRPPMAPWTFLRITPRFFHYNTYSETSWVLVLHGLRRLDGVVNVTGCYRVCNVVISIQGSTLNVEQVHCTGRKIALSICHFGRYWIS